MARIKKTITVTIDPGLLEAVNKYVKANGAASRSDVFNQALQLWRQWQIDRQIREYYENLTPEQRIEEDELDEFVTQHSLEALSDDV